MTELLFVAQAAPSTQSISLLQLVIGLVSVVLVVAGIAWKAGRTVATKDDLAALKTENEKAHAGIAENVMENRRQIQQIDATMRSIDRSVTFMAGRQHERDQSDESRPYGSGKTQQIHGQGSTWPS